MYSETAHGLSTIRAMRATDHFYEQYRILVDNYLRAQFAELASNKWLDTRLQLLGVVIIAAVVLMSLLMKSSAGEEIMKIFLKLNIPGTGKFN